MVDKMILPHLYKYTWVFKTICFQHISFTFQEIPNSHRVTFIFKLQSNRPQAEMFHFFSLPLSTISGFIPNQRKTPCRTSLPSWWCSCGCQVSYSKATMQLQTDDPQEEPQQPSMATRLLSCARPTEQLLAPLTTKTEFTLNLLLCTSQNSFKDYRLLEFSSTASLHYQNLY